jgi:hypothetical protein
MATEIHEFTLYGGEVKVKFYPNSHMYKVTDEKYGLKDQRVKGVTTYLGIKDKSQALVSWAVGEAGLHLYDIISSGQIVTMDDVRNALKRHTEIKDEAALIGTAMHAWCEYFIKHKLKEKGYEEAPKLPEDPQILLGVNSFLEWYVNHHVEFLSSERIVYSRKHQYIGTMDFEAYVDKVLTGGDFKSSNGLYNSVRAQISAYIEAAEEEAEHIGKKVKFQNRVAIRLSKETEQEYKVRMERKNIIKGKEDAPIEPYEPFEWKVFEGRESHEDDFKRGFLAAKTLLEWDQATDFYLNRNK